MDAIPLPGASVYSPITWGTSSHKRGISTYICLVMIVALFRFSLEIPFTFGGPCSVH